MQEGQRFEISGTGFDIWPSEIVLGFSQVDVLGLPSTANQILRVVQKSDDLLIFEANATLTFSTGHLYNFFASPFVTPRGVLEYRVIG